MAKEEGAETSKQALIVGRCEASVFAAELLMPEPAVRAAFAGSVEVCAAALRVSEEAMHWRLFNLGLTQEAPR